MKNTEFVPYEQALELKEIGFDEPCFVYYDNDKLFIVDRNSKIEQKNSSYEKNELYTGTISAPTFSQAFRWFREKYRLHSTITSISQESWQWHITKPGESLGKLYDEDFYTYEEAELACLIKLIEICHIKKK